MLLLTFLLGVLVDAPFLYWVVWGFVALYEAIW